jgi:hypothetical protein
MRGAKMKRAIKFSKKRAAMKKTSPALALKGSGMGHDFSILIISKTSDGGPHGQAFPGKIGGGILNFLFETRVNSE